MPNAECRVPSAECQITISSSTCRGGIISSTQSLLFSCPCGWRTRSTVTLWALGSLLTVSHDPLSRVPSSHPSASVRVALEEFLARQIITYTHGLRVWATPIISQLNRLKVRNKQAAQGTHFVMAQWAGNNLRARIFPGRGSLATWSFARCFLLSSYAIATSLVYFFINQ